jgi:hypothetical protein
VCIEARLRSVARAASFPDWLGYLGIVCTRLSGYEINRTRIGTAWPEQFIEMDGNRHAWEWFVKGRSPGVTVSLLRDRDSGRSISASGDRSYLAVARDYAAAGRDGR